MTVEDSLSSIINRDWKAASGFVSYLLEQENGQWLEFWLLVEQYKATSPLEERRRFADAITTRFLRMQSPQFLSVDSEICSRTECSLTPRNAAGDAFEEVQTAVWKKITHWYASYRIQNINPKNERKKKRKKSTQLDELLRSHIERKALLEPQMPRGTTPTMKRVASEEKHLHLATSEPQLSGNNRSVLTGIALMSPQTRDEFVKLITKPPFFLARELVVLAFTIDQPDVLVDAIVDLFLTNKIFSDFLQAMIQQEVEELGERPVSTLFGKNSVVALLIGSVMQRTCMTYREQLLHQQIKSILSKDNNGLLLETGESGDRNVPTLGNAFSQQIEDLTNCITTSVADFPAIVERYLYIVASTVDSLLPDHGAQATATLYFTHFLYPALVAPDSWLKSKEFQSMTRHNRKTLALIGKALVYIGTQGTPLDVLGDINLVLTKERGNKMLRFMKHITKIPTGPPEDPFLWIGNRDSNTVTIASTHVIKQFMGYYLPILWKQIIRRPLLARDFFPFIRAGFCDLLQSRCKIDK